MIASGVRVDVPGPDTDRVLEITEVAFLFL